jgi:hypothetical protein
MSRHDLIAFSKQYDVIVGWDPPMETFFAQVEDLILARRDDDNALVVWVGTSYREIIRPEDLAVHVARYAILTDEDLAILRADRAATLDRGGSALQRLMRMLTSNGGHTREEE